MQEQLRKAQKNAFTLDDFASRFDQVKSSVRFEADRKCSRSSCSARNRMPHEDEAQFEADGEGAETD